MNDNISGGPASTRYTGFMVRAQNDQYKVVSTGAEVNSGNDNTIGSPKNGSLKIGEPQLPRH